MIRYERESTDITLWNRQVGAHLLEQISHLDLHVFYHLSDVSNMRRELLEGMILFNLLLPDQPSLFFLHQSSVQDRPKHEKTDLSSHAATERSFVPPLHLYLFLFRACFDPTVDHRKHDRRRQLVMRLTSALGSLEYVDRVP